MTGFNVRVVNPGLKPLKGYWTAINDSGHPGQLWNKVSWTLANTNGCSIEVFVRAADERTDLGSAQFLQTTNGVSFPSIRGRYIEVRLGMVRDDPINQPVLLDLALSGESSAFIGENFLYGAWAAEGGDATFSTDLFGAEPIGYKWYRVWPWETNWVQLTGETNSYLTLSNVDPWVNGYTDENDVFHGTWATLLVTNGNGESLWLGPSCLTVDPVHVEIPATTYPSYQGPATRYPMPIRVFGMPTNFNSVSMTVTLYGLNHSRSADISVLLVSPLGKQTMLMSNLGGTNAVLSANVSFQHGDQQPVPSDPIQSGVASSYGPSSYGGITQMPQVGPDPPPPHTGPYSVDLSELQHDSPNGTWQLYIHDTVPGARGHLDGSWQLRFRFQ